MVKYTQDEFRRRILGDKIDFTNPEREIDEIAFGIFCETMPSVPSMKRIKNLLLPRTVLETDENTDLIYPLYFKIANSDSSYFLGNLKVDIENFKRIQSILKGLNFDCHWVVNGTRDAIIEKEDLVSTIRFKEGVTIHDII